MDKIKNIWSNDWKFIVLVITIIFNAGVMYSNYTNMPTKDDVTEAINQKVEGEVLPLIKANENRIYSNQTGLTDAEKNNKRLLNELKYNLRNFFETNGYKYIELGD